MSNSALVVVTQCVYCGIETQIFKQAFPE